MKKPGKMLREVLGTAFKKPATILYPFVKVTMPDKFRGRIRFIAEKCIGCKMCMRDCPSDAITIRKVGDKRFECVIDSSKCVFCAQCVDTCPKAALESTGEFELAALKRENLRQVFDAPPEAEKSATPEGDPKDKA